MSDPVAQQVRADGRVEWVCEHGVGHTVFVQFPSPDRPINADWKSDASWIHGCDGCCGGWEKPKKKRNPPRTRQQQG